MHLAVVIPAFNEERGLPLVLEELQRMLSALPYVNAHEIIVSDNASTDRTAENARAHGARVVYEARRGYGAACLAALATVPPQTDTVVFIDADHSVFAEDLPWLLAPLNAGYTDLVLGVRRPVEGGALTTPQRWGNALACSLMWQLYGHSYHDLCPFRAIRWEALKAMRMQDAAFGWTIEMQIKALRQKLRIQEVPVRYRVRVGTSKISGTVMGSIKAGIGILRTIMKYA